MIHHWKAKNPLFLMMCCNINLVKPFGNYVLLNTGSTAKNLCSRHDYNLSGWNQYYRPSCMSYSIESQSYPGSMFFWPSRHSFGDHAELKFVFLQNFHV